MAPNAVRFNRLLIEAGFIKGNGVPRVCHAGSYAREGR